MKYENLPEKRTFWEHLLNFGKHEPIFKRGAYSFGEDEIISTLKDDQTNFSFNSKILL